ncbi:MAG: hypothetical protein JO244_15465 [Solirubrobacterales bacterium]|nr:hypothetical protein [Solirubrobacterales bacterium]
MPDLSLINRATRGLVAGAIGTAAMTAWQDLSAKLQSAGEEGRGGGDPRGEGAGSGEDSDPWAQAPAPAQAGRLILHELGYEVPSDKIGLLTNVMHWGYGIGWGAVYGAVAGNAARQRPLARGLVFGASVWVMSYVQLVPLGIYQPPWDYPSQELALDLSYHLAYGAGVGAGGALVER